MRKDNTITAFFALLRAGLWEKEVKLASFGKIDFSRILSLSEEQTVVGLVAAGLEHVTDLKVPKEDALQFVGQALQLEQKNQSMNSFIGLLVDKMRKAGINTLLVKGQGVAQCYERPLWRACGDVDFFLSDENYEKAKAFLAPMASSVEKENAFGKHLGMTIDSWKVELHGRLYGGVLSRIDKELDRVYQDTFYGGSVRSWDNSGVQVFQLKAENDTFYVFTHILQHFFKGGVGIRQVCDWCRLLWTYRDTMDIELLEQRIRRAGLISEWRAFGAFAVEYLGMPVGAMPFYSEEMRRKRKAKRIMKYILSVGNMGHNRDNSYYSKYPYLIRKAISFGRRSGDFWKHAWIFPLDSLRFFGRVLVNGVEAVMRGE